MAAEQVRIESLEWGHALKLINEELGRIARDVIERPHLEKAREVVVRIAMKPQVEMIEGEARNMPEISYSVGHKIPGQGGITMRGFVGQDGKTVMVNMNDPLGEDHPAQTNVFDMAERAGALAEGRVEKAK